MSIDLADVQTHVLRSLAPHAAVFIFFRIAKPKTFREFLGSALRPDSDAEPLAAIRSEATRAPEGAHRSYTHLAFTHAGLRALEVDPETLGTFPEPFRDGMARRAAILGDTGPAAPEHWDGYLGSREVHGVMWWLFSRRADGGIGKPREPLQALRDLVEQAGATVLHHETGEGNFRHYAGGELDSVEHFGFRDGLSQPWVELGADAPPPGGGTPGADGSWAPLAPGEFLLGYPDEDGLVQPWPCNRALRQSGTYMVFRKLEQDVAGFRAFLRAGGRGEQEATRLAANLIGRWPDGRPLVHAPGNTAHGWNASINDFRYQKEDPSGRRCPIGAHVRRTNPRDAGNRDEVRRHRLLRRGISYGGDLLPEGSAGDGVKRGLLFIALNARIDQQFEFVQGRWINGGEFLGQVGASRDPMLAAHEPGSGDCCAFPPAPAPVTGLTRFVTMRGGDYFFVPGIGALKELAAGNPFRPEYEAIAPEDAIGLKETPDPLDLARKAGVALSAPDAPDAKLEKQRGPRIPGGADQVYNIAFVARHRLVTQVLEDDETFTVAPYAERVTRMLGHEQLLISLPRQSAERDTRTEILHAAFARLGDRLSPEAVAGHTAAATISVLNRCRRRGALEVVEDLGRVVPIGLAERLFGDPARAVCHPPAPRRCSAAPESRRCPPLGCRRYQPPWRARRVSRR